LVLALPQLIVPALGQQPPTAQHEQKTKMQEKSGYTPVNGLKLYYESHGSANVASPPPVLLHGGGDTINTSFGQILPELARNRQVIASRTTGLRPHCRYF